MEEEFSHADLRASLKFLQLSLSLDSKEHKQEGNYIYNLCT